MAKRRDTVSYALYDGHKKVYIGTTNDPVRRAEEHAEEPKRFSRLQITSSRLTEEGAIQKEEEQLEVYRQGHGGQNPRYNKDTDG